jgi:predicted DNA-binding transcriptional regulator AlpA
MSTAFSSTHQTPDPLLPLPEVLTLIGVAESTWWAGVASGRFPPPVKCGRRSFWPQSVIANFIETLKLQSGEESYVD